MPPTNSEQRALEIVFEAIDEVNPMLPPERQLEKKTDVNLSGDSGRLDSLGLISLVVAVEAGVQRHLGQELALADKIGTPNGTLATVGSLAQYIVDEAIEK